MTHHELKHSVENLLYDYAACLNNRQYEDFPAFFEEENCRYEIQSRENYDLGLPTPIMGCFSHGMIKDRVAQLVDGTLTYHNLNLRHYISNLRVEEEQAGIVKARSNFQVIQSDQEGISNLYLVGRYEDEILISEGSLKFVKKIAILDSFAIHNMLAVPV